MILWISGAIKPRFVPLYAFDRDEIFALVAKPKSAIFI
jgi:hypothetical protein